MTGIAILAILAAVIIAIPFCLPSRKPIEGSDIMADLSKLAAGVARLVAKSTTDDATIADLRAQLGTPAVDDQPAIDALEASIEAVSPTV
jgi:hypothetical protein